MRQLLKFFLSLLILSISISCSSKESVSLHSGEYSVVDCIPAENNFKDVLTTEQKEKFLGKKLLINTNSIVDMLSFTQDVCYMPKIEIETYNTLEYFEGNTSLINRVGYRDNQVRILKTSCESVFLREMVLVDDNTLLYGVDNYLLLLQKSH